jgi:hypothetical protein
LVDNDQVQTIFNLVDYKWCWKLCITLIIIKVPNKILNGIDTNSNILCGTTHPQS